MEIPGLGRVTKDEDLDWYYSEPLPVRVLRGKLCRIVVNDSYEGDSQPGDFHAAIGHFLAASPSILKEAEPHIFRYYQSCKASYGPDEEIVQIQSPSQVWDHIQFGDEPEVRRRGYGDRGIYISLECSCDWEPEHGLQIVFKNGQRVNKVGQYDGHVTHSDAYDDEALEDVIYPVLE